MIEILQLTDTHILGNKNTRFLGVNTTTILKELATKIKNMKLPHLITLTGDISHDASRKSYKITSDILSPLQTMFVWTAGNHDNKENAQQIFSKTSNISYSKVVQFKSWQIILLNSFHKNYISGYLRKSELSFLKETLETNPDKYILIFLHHHILPVGSKWLDQTRLENHADFLKMVKKYSNIKIIASGHTHQYFYKKCYGIDFITTPAASVQFTENTKQLQLAQLMPGFRRFRLYRNGNYTTKILRIRKNRLFVPNLETKSY